jgi:hypothetical protein
MRKNLTVFLGLFLLISCRLYVGKDILRIKSLTAIPPYQIKPNTCSVIFAEVEATRVVTYSWQAEKGKLYGKQKGTTTVLPNVLNRSEVIWQAPAEEGEYKISVTVKDTRGVKKTASITLRVSKEGYCGVKEQFNLNFREDPGVKTNRPDCFFYSTADETFKATFNSNKPGWFYFPQYKGNLSGNFVVEVEFSKTTPSSNLNFIFGFCDNESMDFHKGNNLFCEFITQRKEKKKVLTINLYLPGEKVATRDIEYHSPQYPFPTHWRIFLYFFHTPFLESRLHYSISCFYYKDFKFHQYTSIRGLTTDISPNLKFSRLGFATTKDGEGEATIELEKLVFYAPPE